MKTIIHFLAFLVLMCGGASAHAQSCKKIGTECIQGAETRVINGVSLTRSCWQYQDKYDCYESTAVDTCAPLREKQGCFELTATCSEKNYSGQCVRFATTMRCDHQEPTPAGATALPPVFAVKQDELVAADICGKLTAEANCTKTGRICSQGPETRIVNGMSVFKDCWQYQDQFSCVNPNNTTSTCDLYANNPKCTVTGSKCIHTLPGGQCGAEEKTYSCETKPAQTTSQEVCKNMTCDLNGLCIPSADQADNDFGQVATSMEMARQIGVYTDPNSISIFGGEHSECSKGKLGIKSCCRPTAGAANNSEILSTAVSGGASIGKELADIGSMYVYDSLMSADTLQQGMGAMISAANNWFTPNGVSEGAEFFNGNFDPSFSYMGFTASFGAATATTGSMMLGNVGGVYFSFNPYMLAAQLVLQWVMSCDASDGKTAMLKGQNLCHHVGTYCASKALGACVESKESHCCYNSRLARIVQQQGRQQIGKSWGSAESPQCGGFTPEEFQRLDMSSMDLSEFIAEIQAKAVNTIPGTTRAIQNVGTKVTDYFSSTTGTKDNLDLPANASGNLHQTPTGNALNKATSKP
jgi:conjugal transfer mating pair stabilization protein TraN